MVQELLWQAERLHGGVYIVIAQQPAHRIAEPADDAVVFNRDDQPVGARRAGQRLVHGLAPARVHDRHPDTLIRQPARGLHTDPGHRAHPGQQHVRRLVLGRDPQHVHAAQHAYGGDVATGTPPWESAPPSARPGSPPPHAPTRRPGRRPGGPRPSGQGRPEGSTRPTCRCGWGHRNRSRRPGRARTSRAAGAARHPSAPGQRHGSETSRRSRRPGASRRARTRRRWSPRAARRCRRRTSAPGTPAGTERARSGRAWPR